MVPYRLAGNLDSYLATDHKEHWLPLVTWWEGGHQVFEPVGGRWPEVAAAPDPWTEAVDAAAESAKAYFEEQRNWQGLRRLPRA